MERFFTWKKRNKTTASQAQQGTIPPSNAAGSAGPNQAPSTNYTSPPPNPHVNASVSSAPPNSSSQPAPTAPIANELNASNSLLSEILAIIDHSKNVSIIDSPKTSVHQDLAELKQTCDGARSTLQNLAKQLSVLPGPAILETLNQSMQEVRKVLLALEKAVPSDFWHQTKVRVYQLDFLLKMQSDQIALALSTSDYPTLISNGEGKKWWHTTFGDKVCPRPPTFFSYFPAFVLSQSTSSYLAIIFRPVLFLGSRFLYSWLARRRRTSQTTSVRSKPF